MKFLTGNRTLQPRCGLGGACAPLLFGDQRASRRAAIAPPERRKVAEMVTATSLIIKEKFP
jgi:hypothetical protein